MNILVAPWMPLILAVQLLLVFFIPPVGMGARKLFAGDLWCLVWVVPILSAILPAYFHETKKLRRFLVLSLGLLLLIYAHGYFRPLHKKMMSEVGLYWGGQESELFNAPRELVVALRFLSWIWAGGIVTWWFSFISASERRLMMGRLQKLLVVCLGIVAAMMVVAKLDVDARALLGHIFQYDPEYRYWAGRMYGPFQSPVEAGTTAGLAVLILLSNLVSPAHAVLSRAWSIAAVVLGVLAVLLSQTSTPLVAFAVCGAVFLAEKFRVRPLWFFVFALIAGAAFVGSALLGNTFLLQKLNNLVFRFSGWGMYGRILALRWDYLLLGFGFSQFHTDSTYLFVLTRGGLVAFFAFLAGVASALARFWKTWSLGQKLPVIYLLIVSLTFDVLIFRHVVAVLLATGLPLLVSWKADEKESS